MEDYLDLRLAMIVGSIAAALILYSRWGWGRRIAGVGLVPAYLMSFCLIHWPGAALYLLPWYWGGDAAAVEAGFIVSVHGILAFGVGSVIGGPLITHFVGFPRSTGPRRVPEQLLARIYLCVGFTCYGLLLTVAGGVPTVTALVATGWHLVIVGLGLACWAAWQRARRSFFVGWLIVAALLPLFTLISQGFLSYGVAALFAVLALVVTFARPKPAWLIVGMIALYLGLSFYVTYMRDRAGIRDVVWKGAPAEERIAQLVLSVSNPQWFDPYDVSQLERIDERLNQNVLVGAAVRYLEVQQNPFARGETLWEAVIALIPRALWPEKPVTAGSGTLVTRYTGISFSPTTSVGIGHVMEFYVNFGRVGVVVGFALLGIVISLLDLGAHDRLMKGDWQHFALWYLPGLALLQTGGSLVEMTSTAGAAFVVVMLVNRLVVPDLRGRPIIVASGEAAQG